MSKNIVIFSDGTGQDGGIRPEQRVSNIYKMYRSARVAFDTATNPAGQVTMYDPGLGTDLGTTALTASGRFVQKLLASVDGRGITRNIADCYEFIINHYEPDDRVFLFGFSRGAYTVRSVANLLRLCGIPTKTPTGSVPRFRRATRLIAEEATDTVLEYGAGLPIVDFDAERDELARRFREKYGSHDPGGMASRSNAAPYFIGVFDTVAALGASGLRRRIIQAVLYSMTAFSAAAVAFLPAFMIAALVVLLGGPFWTTVVGIELVAIGGALLWFTFRQRKQTTRTIKDYPKPGESRTRTAVWEGKNFDRLLSRFVGYARSANAIDETRADFARVGWGPAKGLEPPPQRDRIETFKQYFFAGNHSDIGGSYAEVESRLSDNALAWMIEQAVEVPNGLRVGPVFINGVKLEGTDTQGQPLHLFPASDGVQHSEIAAMRDTLEGLRPSLLRWLFRNQNYGDKPRTIPPEGKLHDSVYRRFDQACVVQADGIRPYRPETLRHFPGLERYYPPVDH